jgi:hypothetical protein
MIAGDGRCTAPLGYYSAALGVANVNSLFSELYQAAAIWYIQLPGATVNYGTTKGAWEQYVRAAAAGNIPEKLRWEQIIKQHSKAEMKRRR